MQIFNCVMLLVCFLLTPGGADCSVRYLDAERGTDTEDCLCTNCTAPPPCKTLRYALNETSIVPNLRVLVRPTKRIYEYGASDIQVKGSDRSENLTIQKDLVSPHEPHEEVVFRCSFPTNHDSVPRYNNLQFVGTEYKPVKNLTIRGIIFEMCGWNSAGLYINFVDGISISNCTFRNNTGTGLILRFAANISIKNCTFVDNTGMRTGNHLSDSKETSLLGFSPGGLMFDSYHYPNPYATISGCHFINNTAIVNELLANIATPPLYTSFGSGGAMLIRIRKKTTNARITITSCNFSGNSAEKSGGSLYVPILDGSTNNTLIISNSVFENSSTQKFGGAISLEMNTTTENYMIIEGNTFRNNNAEGGGGAVNVVVEGRIRSTGLHNIATFKSCTFEDNLSQIGASAVELTANGRVAESGFSITFKDSNFTANIATDDTSAVLAFRLLVAFKGTTNFSGNAGGCISLVHSTMTATGTILFQNNTAIEGAGIVIEEEGIVNLQRNTHMTFSGNSAETMGGAMLVRNPVITDERVQVYNLLCFIQYEIGNDTTARLPPSNWMNVSVTFTDNTAKIAGAAIYAHDLSLCTFRGFTEDCQTGSNNTVYQDSIFQEMPFSISNDNSTQNVSEVATEPHILTVLPKYEFGAPGDDLQFEIQAHDQSGNPRGAIVAIEEDQLEGYVQYFGIPDTPHNHSKVLKLLDRHYPTDGTCDSNNQTNGNTPIGGWQTLRVFITEAITRDFDNENDVPVTLSCCHPGYHYDDTEQRCSFISDNHPMLRREHSNRYVYLQPGHYAGFYNDALDKLCNETYFATTTMSSVFQNCTKEGTRRGCLYLYDSPDTQCADGRTGYACGRCPDGTGVDLTLRNCQKCTWADSVTFFVVCVLIVIFSTLVLYFNIGVPNDLLGFLFFAQVIGFVYKSSIETQQTTIHNWDFHLSRAFGFIYLPICPTWTPLPALWTVTFGFLPSLLAIVTVIIYVTAARFIRSLSNRTAFDGIWLIFLLVYKYLADTVTNILKCVKLEGTFVGAMHLVYFYDGGVPCFAGDHLWLSIPTLLLLVGVVLPAPFFIILIGFKRFKFTQPFTDVITCGIKTKCRWWYGFDLLRRLMFIFGAVIFDIVSPTPGYVQLYLCFTTLVVLAIFCATKPYEKRWINAVEAAILLDLLLLTAVFLNERSFLRAKSSTFVRAVVCTMLLLPFTYAVLNICRRVMRKIWRRYIPVTTVGKLKYYFTPKAQQPRGRAKTMVGMQPLLEPGNLIELGDSNRVRGENQQRLLSASYHLREELLESYYQ